jgi:hypothetical protein
VVTLSVEGDEEIRSLERWLEPRLGPEGELCHLSGWANKLAGGAARLAGIHHFAEYVEEDAVTGIVHEDTVRRAVRIARDYLLPHALAAFDLMEADPKTAQAKTVLRCLCRHRELASFTRADLYQKRRTFKSSDELEQPLKVLIDHRYLRIATPDSAKRTGPRTDRFEVNPLWHREGTAETTAGQAADREPGMEG